MTISNNIINIFRNAWEMFQKIKKINLFERDFKKFRVLKAFYDFYKRYQNNNKAVFGYDIFKE
jgi:hypothetical protein